MRREFSTIRMFAKARLYIHEPLDLRLTDEVGGLCGGSWGLDGSDGSEPHPFSLTENGEVVYKTFAYWVVW